MDEIQQAFDLGVKGASLGDKLLGLLPLRRQADADSSAAMRSMLADQAIAFVEANITDPRVLDLVACCGGKFGLENIIRILRLAGPQLNEDANPDLITDDWAANFRDKARTHSDPEMAELWAQLLAGEANKPGSFSRKTVSTLAEMEPRDARLFKTLCGFRLIPGQPIPVPQLIIPQGQTFYTFARLPFSPPYSVVLDDAQSIYTAQGITFNSLARLDWLGLIRYLALGYESRGSDGKFIGFEHGGGLIFVASEKPIKLGRVEFLPAGAEMSELCVPFESHHGFVDYLTETWQSQGVRVVHTLGEALKG